MYYNEVVAKKVNLYLQPLQKKNKHVNLCNFSHSPYTVDKNIIGAPEIRNNFGSPRKNCSLILR